MSNLQETLGVYTTIPLVHSDNSLSDILERGEGFHLDVESTLSANNTSQTINIAQVTSSVQIIGIFGQITSATTLTNATGAYLDLWDGTNSVDITNSSGGASFGGFAVDAVLYKGQAASQVLDTIQNDQARVTEPSADKKQFQPFIITQKTGTNTYLRFTYTTTDAPIDAEIEWHIFYKHLNGGTLTAV